MVIAPPLPTETARQTRGRSAQRRITPAEATKSSDIHVQCRPSSSVGGVTLESLSVPVTTMATS